MDAIHLTADSAAPAMLDVRAVADRLGLSAKAVRALIVRGELPAYKLANRIRVDANDLEAFVSGARVMPAARTPPPPPPPPAGRTGSLRALARATPYPFPSMPERP